MKLNLVFKKGVPSDTATKYSVSKISNSAVLL